MVLQIWATITNYGNRYYKLGQLLQIGTESITNWSRYYKLGQFKSQCIKTFHSGMKDSKICSVLGQALKPNLRTNLITFDSNQLRKRGYLWVNDATRYYWSKPNSRDKNVTK